jgi:hypothetical protein
MAAEHFSGGTLVDERTGRRDQVARSGCEGLLAGGPWLLFYCHSTTAPSYALYSMPRHRMVRTGMSATGGMNPVAIGSDWIQYFVVATGGYVFENVTTQRLRSLLAWRAGGTTVPDLNSRSLARKLCAPLRVPADWTPYARWSNYPFNEKLHAGTVTLLGGSTILTGTSHPDSSGAYHDVSYAQRCGTRHRQSLAGPPFSINAHLVIGGVDGAGALRLTACPGMTKA